MSIDALRQELKTHLFAARALCDLAQKGRRDFTAPEKKEVERHLAEAERLKSEIKRLEKEQAGAKRRQEEGDDALRKALHELGADQDFGGYSLGGGHPAWSMGTPWSKAFHDEVNRFGYRPGQKALISPSGSVAVPSMESTITPLGDRVETILQLIPRGYLNGTDGFSYLQETVRTHNAAVVAVGTAKPESVYTVQRVDDRVRTIAHLSEPIPRQYLADIASLNQYIDMVLREGYQLALEEEIIQGTGVDEHFSGLLGTSGIQVQLFAEDLLTTTRKAITLLQTVSIEPGAYVFHPSDWEKFELLKESGGAFLLKDATNVVPIDRARRRLWGYPVALSLGVPEGTGLLVDFAGSTRQWEREAVNIDWSENVYDASAEKTDFERNLIRFRCEGRAGFAVLRPRGVVEIELTEGS
jgi:HK97 family phage major capsid protein